MITPGQYHHYKGNDYEVIGIARHSETNEELVVYRPITGASELWVRPLNVFEENVTVNGVEVPRFKKIM